MIDVEMDDKLQESLESALKDFSSEAPEPDNPSPRNTYKPRERFPIPTLVLITLRDFYDCEARGPFEKIRWSVACGYCEQPVVFEMRKFGFTICYPDALKDDIRALLQDLGKAVEIVEKALETFAKRQTDKGQVTIPNRYGQFHDRYEFFREKAADAYDQPRPEREVTRDDNGEIKEIKVPAWKSQTEGKYLTAAMVDAYFSRLEHLLILLLPFTSFQPEADSLRDFLFDHWNEKFKVACDLDRRDTKRAYDALIALRREFRNPMAHGGIEKPWGSMYFHVPGALALPACLTGVRETKEFRFQPFLGETSHEEICSLFDSTDEAIRKEHPRAFEFAESGLDIAFDEKSRKNYHSAMESEEKFQDFIRGMHLRTDMHMNMDY